MASGDDFQGLVLNGVTPLDRDELGRGAYGRVYAIKYHGTICAAKEIHSILVEGVEQAQMQRTVQSFMRECRQCSTLRHPNVVQFLGVYYPSAEDGVCGRIRLPVMVMEMLADSLTTLVDKHEKIPVHIKFSIIHDVSLGLCYLHNHDPPIVHRDLSPNNILLTTHHIAKISDLGVAKVIKADSTKTMTKAPGTADFMCPEALTDDPEYGPPMDVFSFAGIILHTFTQQWPHPTEQVQFDCKTRKMVAFSEVERRQQFLEKFGGRREAKVLRPLVEKCLDNDPAIRPTIAAVSEEIQVSKDVYKDMFAQDVITLYQQVVQLQNKNEHKEKEMVKKNKEIHQLKQQLSSSVQTTETPLLRTEAPPLMPTLTSCRYQIKWTQLANLPAPMYNAYVTVQDKKVYVAGGGSSVDDALHRVYVYDVNINQWGQLPPSGHYYGVPQMIGGKLTIIGGRLSATKERTNTVSTFDATSHTWISYYPKLLSVRAKPGVVTYLEHVIVAGGGLDDTTLAQDDIEVLNWVENSHWRKVSIYLPKPMYGFTPIIADDHFVIVGYQGTDQSYKSAYKILVNYITRSGSQQQTSNKLTKWITITETSTWYDVLIPDSSPLVVIGGLQWSNYNFSSTSDIKLYDDFSKSWKKIASLPSARTGVAIASVSNNAIIVVGGYTNGGSATSAKSSSLTTVELGQAQLRSYA